MSKKISVPRGTADILPDETIVWNKVEQKARNFFKTYGYKEIRTPIFEESVLFKRSLGQTSDVVNKQLLELKKQADEDSSGESHYALRPEGTASIVRAYIEHSLDKKESISKLFYLGPMFRGERPQKGRLRQFHQVGIEVIGPGTAHPYLDAEVISLAINFLKSLGWTSPRLLLNTLGSAKDKENFAAFLKDKLDSKKTQLCPDCQSRIERNVFRVLDCKNKTCQGVVDQLKLDYSYLSKENTDYYGQVKDALRELKIDFTEMPKLVRGLDYYTQTVFEITDPSLGSQDALGAGGRYNSLVSDLGGPQVDAIGFAMGLERILLAMPEGKKVEEDSIAVFVVPLDEAALKRGFAILDKLRAGGIAADMSYKLASVKSQMRSADKSGARYVIILGEEEAKNETVMLKDMRSGEQQSVSVANNNTEEIIKKIK